jgi:hypothetical protein
MSTLFLFLFALGTPAFAAPDDDPPQKGVIRTETPEKPLLDDEDEELLPEEDKPVDAPAPKPPAPKPSPEDDFEMEDFTATAPKPAKDAPPVADLNLDVAAKDPLGDHFPLTVVAVDKDAIVVEIPVLIAKSKAEWVEDLHLTAVAVVGTTPVTEQRQHFTRASLADFGPTFAFFKLMVPVSEPAGVVKVGIARLGADGKPVVLFGRAVEYKLK